MEPVIALFFGTAALALALIGHRLMVLSQIDRNTRYWVRTIEQAPDHISLPLPRQVPPHLLRAEAIRASRSA